MAETAPATIPDAVRAKVRKGALLLDEVRPGWAAEIALDRLAMETCDRCILGQLYGDYVAGFRSVLKPLDPRRLFAASEFGFTLPADEQDAAGANGGEMSADRLFGPLADAWREEVRARTSPEAGLHASHYCESCDEFHEPIGRE